MIFIIYEPITEIKARVSTQHFMPFDEQHGIKDSIGNLYTPETIVQAFPNSKLVDSIPDSQPPEGQQEAGLFINPQTCELSYEYTDTPIPEATQLEQLKIQQGLIPPVISPTTLEELRENKRYELSKACKEIIYAGIDVTTTEGLEHFSLKEEDQTNLSVIANQIKEGATSFPYHADGKLCRLFSSVELGSIISQSLSFVTYNTTYCNHLFSWLDSCTTETEISSIIYGTALPSALQTNMNTVLGV